MRIFCNYKNPEVYELVNLAPERGREREGRERSKEEGKRETGRRKGGERKKQQQLQRRFQSALSDENHDRAIPIFTPHHRQHFWTYLDFQLLLSSSN